MLKSDKKISSLSISVLVRNLINSISYSLIEENRKPVYINNLSAEGIGLEMLELLRQSNNSLTYTDIKYLLCFSIDMSSVDIGLLFHIDVNSVYSVRYRIKKKLKAFGVDWIF